MQKRNVYKRQQIIILILILLSLITICASFGRYVINGFNNFFVRTQEFYFYSDKLKDNMAIYQIENWTGVDPYTITINMNSTNNNLQRTNYDIPYDIQYTCTSNATCQLSKEQGIILTSTNRDYFNLVITPNTVLRDNEKVTVTITATSTGKYFKTLSAKFTLVVGQERLSYEIVDAASSQYLEVNLTNTLSYYKVETAFGEYNVGDTIDVDTYLNLSNSDKEKCYSAITTLTFNPEDVLLDMTDTNYLNAISTTTTNINGSNYINSITFKIDPISSTKVRFYKMDTSQDYTYPIVNETSIINVSSR